MSDLPVPDVEQQQQQQRQYRRITNHPIINMNDDNVNSNTKNNTDHRRQRHQRRYWYCCSSSTVSSTSTYQIQQQQRRPLVLLVVLLLVLIPIIVMNIYYQNEHLTLSSLSPLLRLATTTTTKTKTTTVTTQQQQQQLLLPEIDPTTILQNMILQSQQNKNSSSVISSSSSLSSPPKGMVWLVSFPNSGTTYTLNIIKSMTHTSFATNYGSNERDTKNNSIPILYNHHNNNSNDSTSSNGPYYRSPELLLFDSLLISSSSSPNTSTSLQSQPPPQPYKDAYIITKTHCMNENTLIQQGNTLNSSVQEFIQTCSTGSRYENYTSISPVMYDIYNTNNQIPVLSGIVHLIRNPYHNIVARMNYQRNQWMYHSHDPMDHKRATFFPMNRTGFYFWCQYKDRKITSLIQYIQTSNVTFYELYLQPISCYIEFYLYFTWHNMVNHMIDTLLVQSKSSNNNSNTSSSSLNVTNNTIMTLYYEDYQQNDTQYTVINHLLYNVLQFTSQQIMNHTIPTYIEHNTNHEYDTLYTQEQHDAIHTLCQVICSPTTYQQLQHYFVS